MSQSQKTPQLLTSTPAAALTTAPRPNPLSWVFEKELEDWRASHKLVDAKTGEEITLPARRTCWDGAEIIVRDFKPSRFEGNEGYVYTNMNETFVPSVVGAKIVPVAA